MSNRLDRHTNLRTQKMVGMSEISFYVSLLDPDLSFLTPETAYDGQSICFGRAPSTVNEGWDCPFRSHGDFVPG